ncbi:hypothetical protein PTSG_02806 [Salpingoeca rosetta]|uniref:Profilin n=1 Tax=Salpingoeca rosetta (strain ATCC 50818 / BSB-021) TaxID=946362 RepID=F2U3D8_SALR5|nr:uncharacterized protein PTSG_02806 [Salpingoeca rosetta]EGD82132.1 hypothetical protein PTSG_02806 [Salpingoeca rosetta]|eukprot:XP_004996315.1 hypothetical protein PTSG_02806 [Salpingoeca rosetta]
MSWQSHVEALEANGHVTKVAIHGQDGNKWASSTDFDLNPDEVRSLIYAIDNEQAAALLPQHGVLVHATKYQYLRRDAGRSIYAKSRTGGAVVCKTTKAVIIATFENPISATDCVCDVERFADFLVSMQM